MRNDRRPLHGPRGARAAGTLLALALAMNTERAAAQALQPEHRRITDQAIAADEATMDRYAARLDAVAPGESPDRAYRLAAAKQWLALARDQYRLNDRSGLVDDAFGRATAFTASIEGGVAPPPTVAVRGAPRVRPELWALADSLKAGEGFRCAAETIAALEVQLVRAGHEDVRCRPTEPHPQLAAADRLAAEAHRLATGCVPAAPIVEAAPVIPTRGEGPVVKPTADLQKAHVTPLREALQKLSVLNIVHFDLNSSTISRTSAAILDSIASVLEGAAEVKVRLWGHTDPRGSAAYNEALGKRRATTVRDYLVAAGVDRDRLTVTSAGKSRLRATGSEVRDHARNRRVELVYSGPTDLRIQPENQERDLQIEKPKTKTPARRAIAKAPGSRTRGTKPRPKAEPAPPKRDHAATQETAPEQPGPR